jgi:hypothetical protein
MDAGRESAKAPDLGSATLSEMVGNGAQNDIDAQLGIDDGEVGELLCEALDEFRSCHW